MPPRKLILYSVEDCPACEKVKPIASRVAREMNRELVIKEPEHDNRVPKSCVVTRNRERCFIGFTTAEKYEKSIRQLLSEGV